MQKFPVEQVKKLGELGFLGLMVDPKYGGSGMDTISYVLAMEEISKIDASVSVAMSAGLRAGRRPSRGVSRADARHAASLAQHQREIRRVTADAHDAAS